MNFFQRNKLTVISVLVIILFGSGIILANIHFITEWSLREARERILSDLNTANHVFESKQEEFQGILTNIILKNKIFIAPLSITGQEIILSTLKKEIGKHPLDVLNLTDEKGNVFAGVFNPELFKDTVSINDVITRVIETGKPVHGVQSVSSKIFPEEAKILVDNVSNGSIAGPVTDEKINSDELSGLMIVAGVPIMNAEGVLTGILAGGRLIINEMAFRDNAVAEDINNIIFGDELFKGEEIGMIAFYISDTFPPITFGDRNGNISGERDNIKVNIKPVVGHEVIGNNCFIAGYDDIRNIRGEVVGMLVTGIRKNIFTDRAHHLMFVFSGITGTLMIVVLFLFVIIYRKGIEPFKKLVNVTRLNVEENFGYGFKNDPVTEPGEIIKAHNYILSQMSARDKECKELSGQVKESKRLATLGQLAAGVAHEINNPLTGVIVYSHLLLEDTDKDDPRYSNIKKVIRESHRCKNIVKSILDFARQSQPHLEPLNVNKIIIEALNNIRRESMFEHVEIVEKFGEKLPAALADPSQIQQVFANIIRNAFEIMDDSGKLTITSRVIRNDIEKQMIEILFEDTGSGIPKKYLERIFDPFFTTKTKGHGTGLGLAVCYGIIERHGGTITVQNREGNGAIFSVILPVEEEKS